jgi:exodeoxyribonuclease VII small subunit
MAELDDITQLGYAQAMDELETILAELESSDVDVDRLAERVARAAALIELCRARIDTARADVERIKLPDP